MDEGHKFVFFFASYKQRWLHYARSQDSFLENALRLRNSSNWNHLILNSSLVCRLQGIFDKRTSTLLSFTFAEPQVSQARFTRTSSLWSCFAKGFVWWKRVIRYRSWAIFWVVGTYERIEYVSQELLCSQSRRLREVHGGLTTIQKAL